jgi:hypothetical protein
MVFHIEPACSSVTPMTIWQLLTPFSWMYWLSVRRFEVTWSPSSRTVPSPGDTSADGYAVCAGAEKR